jgi:hypothetical protein
MGADRVSALVNRRCSDELIRGHPPHPRVSVVILDRTRINAGWADGRGSGVGVGELPLTGRLDVYAVTEDMHTSYPYPSVPSVSLW